MNTKKNIIKKLAKKYNKPEEVIKNIVESQFKCARQYLKKGDKKDPATYYNVRFPKLGTLICNGKKIEKYNRIFRKEGKGELS